MIDSSVNFQETINHEAALMLLKILLKISKPGDHTSWCMQGFSGWNKFSTYTPGPMRSLLAQQAWVPMPIKPYNTKKNVQFTELINYRLRCHSKYRSKPIF